MSPAAPLRRTKDVCLAIVTAPERKTARRLAGLALEARLAACVSLLPGVESHYWWQGKREKGGEILLLFKTSRRQARALQDLILASHPYDTAEFVILPVESASARYLAWWRDSLRGD